MLRITGAILILAAASFMGINSSFQLDRHVSTLSSFSAALELMQSEISSLLTPIPELIEKMQLRQDTPASVFFKSCHELLKKNDFYDFSEIWCKALTSCEALELEAREFEVLCSLGNVLGRYEAEEQSAAIKAANSRIKFFLRAAEEEKRSQGKLRAVFGIAAGITVVIILL